MTRTKKMLLTAIGLVVVVFVLLIGFWAFRIAGYRNGFSKVELTQSKAVVINLMGEPSETRRCSFSIHDGNNDRVGDCFEIASYRGVYEEWAIAFDSNGNVIKKYYWFLGEYGNRPPDTN